MAPIVTEGTNDERVGPSRPRMPDCAGVFPSVRNSREPKRSRGLNWPSSGRRSFPVAGKQLHEIPVPVSDERDPQSGLGRVAGRPDRAAARLHRTRGAASRSSTVQAVWGCGSSLPSGGRPGRVTADANWRNRVYMPAAKAVGLIDSPPYRLRHSFASLLIPTRGAQWSRLRGSWVTRRRSR